MPDQPPERHVRWLAPSVTFIGQQALTYHQRITAATTGVRGLCLTFGTVPPGGRAKAHYHAAVDTAVAIIAGTSLLLYGERLEHVLVARAGELVFIPAGVPHAPVNQTAAPCHFVVAHAADDDQSGIVLCPALDALPVPDPDLITVDAQQQPVA